MSLSERNRHCSKRQYLSIRQWVIKMLRKRREIWLKNIVCGRENGRRGRPSVGKEIVVRLDWKAVITLFNHEKN